MRGAGAHCSHDLDNAPQSRPQSPELRQRLLARARRVRVIRRRVVAIALAVLVVSWGAVYGLGSIGASTTPATTATTVVLAAAVRDSDGDDDAATTTTTQTTSAGVDEDRDPDLQGHDRSRRPAPRPPPRRPRMTASAASDRGVVAARPARAPRAPPAPAR